MKQKYSLQQEKTSQSISELIEWMRKVDFTSKEAEKNKDSISDNNGERIRL